MLRLGIVPRFFPLALLGAHYIYGQDAPVPLDAKTQDVATQLVKTYNAWGPLLSTPNTSLSIKEFTRSGQFIATRLYVVGAPKDKIYSIVTWPVTQKGPSEMLKGVTLDASGLAICAGTPMTCGREDKPDDPIDIVSRPVPGEPVRLGLVSTDGAVKVFAKTVLIPLRGEDRGCAAEAVLLTPGSELILVEGSGFEPQSDLTLDSESEGERHARKYKTDADGRLTTAMLPFKLGLVRGTLKLRMKSAACSPSLEVPWGKRN